MEEKKESQKEITKKQSKNINGSIWVTLILAISFFLLVFGLTILIKYLAGSTGVLITLGNMKTVLVVLIALPLVIAVITLLGLAFKKKSENSDSNKKPSGVNNSSDPVRKTMLGLLTIAFIASIGWITVTTFRGLASAAASAGASVVEAREERRASLRQQATRERLVSVPATGWSETIGIPSRHEFRFFVSGKVEVQPLGDGHMLRKVTVAPDTTYFEFPRGFKTMGFRFRSLTGQEEEVLFEIERR